MSVSSPSVNLTPRSTLGDQGVAFEFLPGLLRFPGQLEYHGQGGQSRSHALGPLRPVPEGRKGALDRVGGPDRDPVLRREVVKRKIVIYFF